MKLLLVPDSFKGSLTSAQAAQAIETGVRRVCPAAKFRVIPMADGGEGTVRAVCGALGGTLEHTVVQGPLGEPVTAEFGLLSGGRAVLEMAAASGLTLVPPERRDIHRASTYGVGQLLLAALDRGCRQIYLGIGGSATNDGGMGMAQALGVRFFDSGGNPLPGCGASLSRVAHLDLSRLDPRVREAAITVMCDVRNPLCGPHGAAAVYGPQKGASPEQVTLLDAGLRHFAGTIFDHLGLDVLNVPGGGAAGGLGAGLLCFCGAALQPGAAGILELAEAKSAICWADLVITGEGLMDASTAFGKAARTVAEQARALGKPVLALCGSVEGPVDAGLYTAVESAVNAVMPLDSAMGRADALLADAAQRAFRLMALGRLLEPIEPA